VPSFAVFKILGVPLKHSGAVDNQEIAKRLTFSKLQVDLDAAAGKRIMGTLNNLSPNFPGVTGLDEAIVTMVVR